MYVLGVAVSILHCACLPSHHFIFRKCSLYWHFIASCSGSRKNGTDPQIRSLSLSLSLSLSRCGSSCPTSQTLPPWCPCYTVHQLCFYHLYIYMYVHSKTKSFKLCDAYSTAHSVHSYKYCEPAFSGKLPPQSFS
jgi:hypothetical protein